MSRSTSPLFCEPYGEGQQWCPGADGQEYSGEWEFAIAALEYRELTVIADAGDPPIDAPSADDEDEAPDPYFPLG
ncbi:MAG TPA: hypothetical protein VG994_10285 [Steroidobacteraceae bacterium]|nr:hypothetical protein [Steroidobacteraceae bacterium]HVY81357.1 hypothetical protein [Steroidobacteraceae bacterium]